MLDKIVYTEDMDNEFVRLRICVNFAYIKEHQCVFRKMYGERSVKIINGFAS